MSTPEPPAPVRSNDGRPPDLFPATGLATPPKVANLDASALVGMEPDLARPAPPKSWRKRGEATYAVRQASRAVATGAARTARTAAYHTTRPVVNLLAGIWCFWRGLGRFVTSPTLWLYAAAPLILLLLAMLGISAAAEAGIDAAVSWGTSFADGWPQWIHSLLDGLLRWSAFLAVHSVLGYLVLPLSIILGAPCYVLLARHLERKLGTTSTTPPPLWRACGVAIRQAVLITLTLHFGWLLLIPLLLIPGLNVLAAFCAVATFNGFLVGLLVLAIPLHHHGVTTFRAQLRVVWRHRASVIGFGAMSGLILIVPVTPLRAVLAPVVFIGAVLLHRRMYNARQLGREFTPPAQALPALPPAARGGPSMA